MANELVKGYTPETALLPQAQGAISRNMADPAFREQYNSNDDTVRSKAISDLNQLHDLASRRVYTAPTQEVSNAAQAKIAALMGDKLFMGRYQSSDNKVRASAIEEMSKLHYEAFGNQPVDDNNASGTVTLRDLKRQADRASYESVFRGTKR